jgi:hypothetical protein
MLVQLPHAILTLISSWLELRCDHGGHNELVATCRSVAKLRPLHVTVAAISRLPPQLLQLPRLESLHLQRLGREQLEQLGASGLGATIRTLSLTVCTTAAAGHIVHLSRFTALRSLKFNYYTPSLRHNEVNILAGATQLTCLVASRIEMLDLVGLPPSLRSLAGLRAPLRLTPLGPALGVALGTAGATAGTTGAALGTAGATAGTTGVLLETGAALDTAGAALDTAGAALSTAGAALSTAGAALSTAGAALSTVGATAGHSGHSGSGSGSGHSGGHTGHSGRSDQCVYAPLSRLQLTTLAFGHTPNLETIAVVARMTTLQALDFLKGTDDVSLSALTRLTGLTSMRINQMYSIDIGLSTLIRLSTLDLSMTAGWTTSAMVSLRPLTALTELGMRQCSLFSSHIADLADVLATLPLAILRLDGNHGLVGAAAIRPLSVCTRLRVLSLRGCYFIGSSGNVWPSLPALRALDLTHTRVSVPELAGLATHFPRASIVRCPATMSSSIRCTRPSSSASTCASPSH